MLDVPMAPLLESMKLVLGDKRMGGALQRIITALFADFADFLNLIAVDRIQVFAYFKTIIQQIKELKFQPPLIRIAWIGHKIIRDIEYDISIQLGGDQSGFIP